MAAHTDLGARSPSEALAGSLLVPMSSPDEGAGGNAIKEYVRPPQKDRSVLDQFMHNLMLALGAWPI